LLTVDYDRLRLEAGHLMLDLGCGRGRHAFEALRRGAHVVPFDRDAGEIAEACALLGAMHEAGDAPSGARGGGVNGDALALPFPDETFDRIIAAEVLEHVTDDSTAARELTRVLRPGGILAVTVPSWLPERICWALSDEYHAPKAVGGHVRIYTEPGLRTVLGDAGLVPGEAHRAHALHSAYWWLKCAVGVNREKHPLVDAYHRLLVWDIERHPRLTRLPERLLNPVLGKSLVVYARKPEATTVAREEQRAA
jgi:SAM-dependent methyltransferase